MQSKKSFEQKVHEWIEQEKSWTCGSETSKFYAKTHQKRFQITFDICKKYVPNRDSRVLNIGRSDSTSLLSSYYNHVTSSGFDLKKDDGGHRENSEIPNNPILFMT